jgi:tRNA-Thr(GGU) m(6)t(6)A37 methyltransferase TsaA
MTFQVEPVAFVRSPRRDMADDFWGGHRSEVELAAGLPDECLDGLDEFSHVEILFVFDRLDPTSVARGARRPRGNPAWPEVGIFAQRAKARPNRIGATLVRVLERRPRALVVEGLDAIEGTPVIDIKPVFREFLPQTEIRQPAWTHEMMRDYWRDETERP